MWIFRIVSFPVVCIVHSTATGPRTFCFCFLFPSFLFLGVFRCKRVNSLLLFPKNDHNKPADYSAAIRWSGEKGRRAAFSSEVLFIATRNRTSPRALVHSQQTRELISAEKTSHKHNSEDLSH